MSDLKDRPAFPHQAGYDFKGQRVLTQNSGMTLREYAAVAAMQGLLADSTASASAEIFAKAAVEFADALIAELEKKA